MTITVNEIQVADPAEAWTRAGFAVADGVSRIGGVAIRLLGPDRGTGIVGWSLRGLPAAVEDLDGVPTTPSASVAATAAAHSNGVLGIDHVVLMSPDLGRTVEAMAAIGVRPRRERDAELGGRAIRRSSSASGRSSSRSSGRRRRRAPAPRRCGASPTSWPTSMPRPRSSVTARHR